jgi:hypothetical protein
MPRDRAYFGRRIQDPKERASNAPHERIDLVAALQHVLRNQVARDCDGMHPRRCGIREFAPFLIREGAHIVGKM